MTLLIAPSGGLVLAGGAPVLGSPGDFTLTYNTAAGWSGPATIHDGQAVTLTKAGGGLGTRTVADKLYENFSGGAHGARVSTVSVFDIFNANAIALNTHGSDFLFDNTVPRAGFSQSGNFRIAPGDDYPPSIRKTLGSAVGEIYISYWLKAIKNVPSSNVIVGCKLVAFAGDSALSFNKAPGAQIGGLITTFTHGPTEQVDYYQSELRGRNAQGGGDLHGLSYNPSQGAGNGKSGYEDTIFSQFVRFEFYARLSSPAGTANGGLFWRVKGFQPQSRWISIQDADGEFTDELGVANDNAFVTLDDHDVLFPAGILCVGLGVVFESAGDWSMVFSDVLVNHGAGAAKRVEIADTGAAWGTYGPPARHVSEVQDALTGWTNTTASFTVNKKGHTTLSGKSIVVVTGPFTAEVAATIN